VMSIHRCVVGSCSCLVRASSGRGLFLLSLGDGFWIHWLPMCAASSALHIGDSL